MKYIAILFLALAAAPAHAADHVVTYTQFQGRDVQLVCDEASRRVYLKTYSPAAALDQDSDTRRFLEAEAANLTKGQMTRLGVTETYLAYGGGVPIRGHFVVNTKGGTYRCLWIAQNARVSPNQITAEGRQK